MKLRAVMVPIAKLLAHERVSQKRVHELVRSFRTEKILKYPILVSKDQFVVLDGHHRVEALRQLEIKYVPAYLIDYYSDDISVTLRRNQLLGLILKKGITSYAQEGKLFPYKTTRHLVRQESKNEEFPLDSCK